MVPLTVISIITLSSAKIRLRCNGAVAVGRCHHHNNAVGRRINETKAADTGHSAALKVHQYMRHRDMETEGTRRQVTI